MRSPAPAYDLRSALSAELRAALEKLDLALEQPKAAHKVRVRVKRARALARVGRAGAPGLSAVFNDSAQSMMRQLAELRDLRALEQTARTIARKQSGKAKAALLHAANRFEAQRLSFAPLDLDTMRAALKDLLALAQVWPEVSPRQTFKGAERVARNARRAFRRGRQSDDAERRHEWRKREKDRQFAAMLLDDAWPRARRRGLGKAIGHTLGQERNAALLIGCIEHDPSLAGEGKAARRALKALRRRRRRLAREANALGDALHRRGA